MRIGIDARFYGITGIGRYVKNLISELEKLDKKNEYVIFLRKENFAKYQPQNPNFSKILANYSWYSFKEQMMMPAKIFTQKVDLMHFPHFNIPIFWPGKFVLTIHDLIHQQYSTAKNTTRPKPVYFFKKLAYLGTIRWAAKRAQKIFVPSKDTKKDVVGELKVDSEKIVVTYEGLDLIFARNREQGTRNEEVLERYGICKPYILYVATMYPHKNIERLLGAFQKLKNLALNLKLVLVGKVDSFSRRIKKKVEQMGLSSQVSLPNFDAPGGYISDEDLKVFYQNASAYIFPSLKEGFGIPILEAWVHDLPVIGSNVSCIPEIGGNAVLYFDPYDINDMVKKIKQVLSDEKVREDLVRKGNERLKKFSWRRMGEQTLKVYQEVGRQ